MSLGYTASSLVMQCFVFVLAPNEGNSVDALAKEDFPRGVISFTCNFWLLSPN